MQIRKIKTESPLIIIGIIYSLFHFILFSSVPSFAADATLLPNGFQQFFDNDGNPLSSGTVDFFIPNTSTRKNTWQDASRTIPNTNPITLDAAGRAKIYGDGQYRQVVKKLNGDLVWDAVTSSFALSGGIVQTGDGDLVGTVKPWAGIVAPNQYAFAYGQELSRTTFEALYNSITNLQNATCTSGSPIATAIADTTQVRIGSAIESPCFASGTTVLSKTTNSVTFSANSSLSTNSNIRFFSFGRGNGTTTFNVPDFRGVTLAGRCNMGGSSCSNLGITHFGANPNAQGQTGGIESKALITANLPTYTPTGTIAFPSNSRSVTISGIANASITDPGHTHSDNSVSFNTNSAAGGATAGVTGTTSPSTSSNTTGISATVNGNQYAGTFNQNILTATFTGTSAGSSTQFSIVQPTMVINYIIKITPDQNSADATGVTSLGLMTGDIACGTGLTCTANTISASATGTAAGNNTEIQYNSGGAFAGQTTLTWSNPTLSIGGVTNTGRLQLFGSASGSLIQTVQNAAGAALVTWGTNTGTPAVTTSSDFVINSGTGNLTLNGQLVLASGGTNNSLVANNGGVVYSDASRLQILAGVASANRLLVSGVSSAPSWSTATYPATTAANTVNLSLTANAVTAAAIPSCSTSSSALIWTTSTGFGCNTISGSGTVNSGTAGQLGYYATSTDVVSGNVNANISNGALTLGQTSSVIGQLKLAGNTNGLITITPKASAGTWTFTLPDTDGTSGEVLSTDGSGNTSWIPASGTGTVTSIVCNGVTITTTGTCPSAFGIHNCSLASSAGANLLTVSLKNAAGSDASAASPCVVGFRNPTASNGTYSSISVTSALSMDTNAIGATLGSSNSTAFRFWVVLFNDGGTPVLGLFNASTYSSTAAVCHSINESSPQSSTAISGSATSAGVYYTPNGTTISNKSVRILGYIEYGVGGLTTAGTYASSPDAIQNFNEGVKRPCEIVAHKYASTISTTSLTTTTFTVTSSVLTHTSTSAVNLIKVKSAAAARNTSTSSSVVAQLSYTSNSNLFGNVLGCVNTGGGPINDCPYTLMGIVKPNSVSALTYGVYMKNNSGAATWTWNIQGGATIELEEVQG